VDRSPQNGAGIHPLPPGALAAAARVGTQGRAELNSLGGSVVALKNTVSDGDVNA